MPGELRRIGAGAAIIDEEGRILLVRHTYGPLNWELPGGLGKPFESPVETALREVREETGLVVVVEWLSGVYYDREVDNHHFMFACAAPVGHVPRVTSPEVSECAFWAPESLPRPISDFTIRRIHDALSGQPPRLPVTISPRQWLNA